MTTERQRAGGGGELEEKAARLFDIQLRQAVELSKLARSTRCEIKVGEITVRPIDPPKP